MTADEKITLLKQLVGSTFADEVLRTYLKLAGSKVIKRRDPFNTLSLVDVPLEYEDIQLDLAVYLINRRGVEGQVTHSENGVSRGYQSELDILKTITPLAGVL